jgi:hypothetical protein
MFLRQRAQEPGGTARGNKKPHRNGEVGGLAPNGSDGNFTIQLVESADTIPAVCGAISDASHLYEP